MNELLCKKLEGISDGLIKLIKNEKVLQQYLYSGRLKDFRLIGLRSKVVRVKKIKEFITEIQSYDESSFSEEFIINFVYRVRIGKAIRFITCENHIVCPVLIVLKNEDYQKILLYPCIKKVLVSDESCCYEFEKYVYFEVSEREIARKNFRDSLFFLEAMGLDKQDRYMRIDNGKMSPKLTIQDLRTLNINKLYN